MKFDERFLLRAGGCVFDVSSEKKDYLDELINWMQFQEVGFQTSYPNLGLTARA